MRTILIADRGESAVRVVRACRDAGLASVAVYADPADRAAVHARVADRAVPLVGLTPAQTYLDPAQVLRAAAVSGADALHPGYGPLAENAEFAQAVLDAGLTWIGSPPAVIRRLGDKLSARRVARQVGAPLLPGTGALSDAAEALAFAGTAGLPGDPAVGGLRGRGDVRVPARSRRHARVSRDEPPAVRGAPGERGGGRDRPGSGDFPAGRGRAAGLR